jgi:hypothetical protein
MDFSQTKLTKMEWESIEIPPNEHEKRILKMIHEGFLDVTIKSNDNVSLLSYMKIEHTPEIEMYIYTKYFQHELQSMVQQQTGEEKGTKNKRPALKKMSSQFAAFRPEMPNMTKCKPPKKIDLLRLQNTDAALNSVEFDKSKIVEFIQIDFCRNILSGEDKSTGKSGKKSYTFYLYTLVQMKRACIYNANKYVQDFVNQLIDFVVGMQPNKIVQDTFNDAYEVIEKNGFLLRFENKTLYDHQKQIFQLFRVRVNEDDMRLYDSPKLVMYTAPTGTGKTMSPLGLSNGYRIIYICAARHVGLALAKSAIAMEKRVAFAFGCETAADIRLHYFAATEYTKNRKTGGIFKVDNSNGTKVEIMICDVRSYLTAMYYMLSFHPEQELLLYWDEPTITLDLETHELHQIIHKNWQENKISNIVLSCATLPQDDEILDCFADYRGKFDNGTVHRITSTDCKKTITLVDTHGYATVPHLLFDQYEDVQKCIVQCQRNGSLLRYLDVREIVRMVNYVMLFPQLLPKEMHVDMYFRRLEDLTMQSIKEYYLHVLEHVCPEKYLAIHRYLKETRPILFGGTPHGSSIRSNKSVDTIPPPASPMQASVPLHRTVSVSNYTTLPSGTLPTKSASVSTPSTSPFHGILLTTADAHTLTDGPTIYLVEDVVKLSKFYLQQTNIPSRILDGIMEKIQLNEQIQEKMEILVKSLDDMLGKEIEKEKKMANDSMKPEAKRLMASIEALRAEIQVTSLSAKYIPNTRQHQQCWLSDPEQFVENAFTPTVEESVIRQVMELGVDSSMKILLLLGIGMFDSMLVQSQSPAIASYMEIMKRMVYDQKIFLILASSDYIYGTNYQLCHGFLGKDLQNMTQQKIIQAMGRVGRNSIQQEYTIRFRDESLIRRVFLPVDANIEAVNMCKLLVS